MVTIIRKTTYFLMQFGVIRLISIPFIAFGNLLRKERINYTLDRRKKLERLILENYLHNNLKVISGPFKGMEYPSFKSFTSTIIPKLIGTYESEIYNDIESLAKDNSYDNVIVIGAADGYYAVGLALLMPQAKIVSYDANPEALYFCKEFKEKNNATNLDIRGVFLDDTMDEFKQKRNLVVCDVDGFEYGLFTNENFISSIGISDVIVETHDYIDKRITQMILDQLSETHDNKVIPYKPLKLDELPESIFKNINNELKRVATLERIVDNKWIIARANSKG